MITITVKFLGGLRQEMGMVSTTLSLPDNSTVVDLQNQLLALGLDLDEQKNIAVLNQTGLGQLPPDQLLAPDDEVMVFPHISGGCWTGGAI
jgi:molybdopterin converting factor small subunit